MAQEFKLREQPIFSPCGGCTEVITGSEGGRGPKKERKHKTRKTT